MLLELPPELQRELLEALVGRGLAGAAAAAAAPASEEREPAAAPGPAAQDEEGKQEEEGRGSDAVLRLLAGMTAEGIEEDLGAIAAAWVESEPDEDPGTAALAVGLGQYGLGRASTDLEAVARVLRAAEPLADRSHAFRNAWAGAVHRIQQLVADTYGAPILL